MAVKGSLESLGIEDLLQADLAAHGEGCLTLRWGAHCASLHIDGDGIYVLLPDLLVPEELIRSFISRGLVSEEAVTEARRRDLSGELLLEYLLEQKQLPQAEYMEVLAASAEDTVLDLMLWESGQFRFEETPRTQSPGLQGSLCVDPKGIVERALTRLDERHEIASVLGAYGILLYPLAGALPPLEHDRDPTHEVYARLDGHTVVHEISVHMGLGRFEVLKAITRLVRAGLARPAAIEELIEEVDRRMGDREYTVARALCLQWEEREPDDPGALKKLATVAASAGRREMELEALCALGHLYIRSDLPREAVSVFKRAMRKAPADEVVLTGLRMAAEAAGDNTVYADSTLLTAQAALDEGKTEDALELLDPLVRADPSNMAAHLLRARALVQSERRAELLEEAEIVGQVLRRGGCKSRQERDAAVFFRKTIAEVAPERGDLLERFRSLHDKRSSRSSRGVLVGVLVLLLGVAGFVFWPTSASSLLERAHDAVAVGDTGTAQTLIAELVERFPDSQEAEEAWALQSSLVRPRSKPPTGPGSPNAPASADVAKSQLQSLIGALPDLPAPDAQAVVGTVLEFLESKAGGQIRGRALREAADPFRTTARDLLKETLDRVAVLGQSAAAPERLRGKQDELSKYIEHSTAARDPAFQERLEASAALLQRLAPLYQDSALPPLAKEVARTSESLGQASRYYDEHIVKCKLTLADLRVNQADRRCQEDAPKLMVAGRLDEADALYLALEQLLVELAGDETYAQLVALAQRRHLPELARDRRDKIADIRGRLAEARKAEETGKLESAIQIYAALAREYWLIRFENVFTLPLRVVTIPPGARIFVDDEEAGVGPSIVRHGWGRRSTVRVEADGFDGAQVKLKAEDEEPASELTLRMRPRPVWSTQVGPRVEMRPLHVDGHLLLVDRSGNATLIDGKDGSVRWTARHTSLEGVKSRPTLAGGRIYLARIEGDMLVLDPATGKQLAALRVGRPFGPLAAQGDRAAVATVDGQMVGLAAGREAWRTSLNAVPATGVEGGHGAFWIGTVQGTVVRVDARSGQARTLSVTRASAPVVALATTADGVLVTSADRNLVCFSASGTERWRRTDVGDVVGYPAQAGGVVAVLDRQGHAQMFDARTGKPRGTLTIGSSSRHGLLTTGNVMIAACDDGRLWAYDPATQVVLADVSVHRRAQFGPCIVGAEQLVISCDGDRLQLIPVPRQPR